MSNHQQSVDKWQSFLNDLKAGKWEYVTRSVKNTFFLRCLWQSCSFCFHYKTCSKCPLFKAYACYAVCSSALNKLDIPTLTDKIYESFISNDNSTETIQLVEEFIDILKANKF